MPPHSRATPSLPSIACSYHCLVTIYIPCCIQSALPSRRIPPPAGCCLPYLPGVWACAPSCATYKIGTPSSSHHIHAAGLACYIARARLYTLCLPRALPGHICCALASPLPRTTQVACTRDYYAHCAHCPIHHSPPLPSLRAWFVHVAVLPRVAFVTMMFYGSTPILPHIPAPRFARHTLHARCWLRTLFTWSAFSLCLPHLTACSFSWFTRTLDVISNQFYKPPLPRQHALLPSPAACGCAFCVSQQQPPSSYSKLM